MADDTEIFTGRSGNPGVRSNILFILDNSDSMGQPFTGGGPTRLEALKDSFSQLISTVGGVNVGIMRFDGPGGSVAYPITDVAEELDIPYVENPEMLESSDDGVENQTTGEVTLGDSSLVLSYNPGGITNESTSAAIQHEDDDAEEATNNRRFTNSNDDIFNMSSGYVSALRFTDLGIPAGAVIDSARIRFTAAGNHTSASTILITADSALNPAI